MTRELFIYFRAAPAHAAALQRAVAAMQGELRRRHPGLEARLLRRPQARDGRHTWMETYRLPGPAGDAAFAALQADVAQAAAALARWIDGARHVEVFDACA